MYAIVRYVFPRIEPWELDVDDLVRYWREAQFIVKEFRLINKDKE